MYDLRRIGGKEVISQDGKVIGKVRGLAVNEDWSIRGLNLRMSSKVIEPLGFKRPLIGRLKKEVKVNDIQALSDKLMLKWDFETLAGHLHPYNDNRDATKLVGMEVVDSESFRIGEVKGLLFDEQRWIMDSIILDIDEDVLHRTGLDRPMLKGKNVQLKAEYIHQVTGVVTVYRPLRRLAQIIELISHKRN